MSFVALIPARLASTRLPNKPLAMIGDLPMVVHVARRAIESGARLVAIATDSAEVQSVAKTHGIHAIMTRSDHQSGTERLAEAAAALMLPPQDIVVNVQGDEPFIDPQLIAQVALVLEKAPNLQMSTAAHPIHRLKEFLSPNVVKLVCNAAGNAMMFSRAPFPYPRDQYPAMQASIQASTQKTNQSVATELASFKGFSALRHIGLYAYRVGFLATYSSLTPSPLESIEALEQLRVLHHGIEIAVHTTCDAPAAGVDTPQDLEQARQHWQRFYQKSPARSLAPGPQR